MWVVYLVAVLLISTVWGAWMGVFTALASALAFNYFHIPPTGRFTIAESENWVALVVFVIVAVIGSSVAQLARTRAEEADQRRREADLAAEMARLLLRGSELSETLPAAAPSPGHSRRAKSVKPASFDADAMSAEDEVGAP